MSRMDLLIFGASGFTGKYVVKEVMKIKKATGLNFTWGVAGRNKEKLRKTLIEMIKNEETSIDEIPIVIADLNDVNSLNEMAKRAKVVLNCCGPYRFYGEPVVKACIENKTNHLDVSGEPEYIETMQLHYHEKAKENEVYVVSACGFDSIPADLGIVFLKNEFDGELNSVEIFLESWTTNVKKIGSSVHYGTWESAVYGAASLGHLRGLRKQLLPRPYPPLQPKLQRRFPLSRCETLKGKWCLPFPGSDKSVIRRSQYFFFEQGNERPIQVETYITFPSFLAAFLVAFAAIVFGLMAKFSLGRQLLLKYPKFFSLNFASREGPPEEEAENTYFSMTFVGEGWKERLSEPGDKHVEAPNKRLITKVGARNPAYGATSIFLIMSGIIILEESDRMPDRGGVYPPGAAFAKTTFIKRLKDLGVKFEVCERE